MPAEFEEVIPVPLPLLVKTIVRENDFKDFGVLIAVTGRKFYGGVVARYSVDQIMLERERIAIRIRAGDLSDKSLYIFSRKAKEELQSAIQSSMRCLVLDGYNDLDLMNSFMLC